MLPAIPHLTKGLAMTTMTEVPPGVTLGADTHRDFNVAAVCDGLGRVLDTAQFPATASGDKALIDWAELFGPIYKAGIEGTGSWGASLSRHAISRGIDCVEVNRTNRQHRRRHGKSDTADAIGAARSVLAGQCTGKPRGNNGTAEALRVNRVVLRSAKRARTQALNQLHSLRTGAVEPLKAQLAGLSGIQLAKTAAAMRPGPGADPSTATKRAMRTLGRRVRYLDEEIADLEQQRAVLVEQAAPKELTNELGIGPSVAADILITFGDNHDRITSERAFAALCGASPVDLSSGLNTKHRLNRGGDRQANCALHRIVITRLVHHQPTRDYITKCVARGQTKRHAIRSLKRYLARHIYRLLQQHPPRLDTP